MKHGNQAKYQKCYPGECLYILGGQTPAGGVAFNLRDVYFVRTYYREGE